LFVWTVHTGLGLPTALAWVLAILGGAVIGGATEGGFMRRVEGGPPIVSIVMTIGLLLMVEGLAGVIWGYGPKTVPTVISGPSITIGSVSVDRNDLFVAGLAVALTLALQLFYQRTRRGLAVRAVAEDPEVAPLMGISRRSVLALSWAVGVALCGVAATLVAPAVSLTPTMMDDIAVFAFAGAVLGGLGSLWGALVGGFAVGILADLVAGYVSANLQLTVVFALIVVVLYLRPQGLFGQAAQVRQ
jgi:branched-chain amino acid transport system permease protein